MKLLANGSITSYPKFRQLDVIKINNNMKYVLAQLCKTLT